jgi:hypothetical protein
MPVVHFIHEAAPGQSRVPPVHGSHEGNYERAEKRTAPPGAIRGNKKGKAAQVFRFPLFCLFTQTGKLEHI